MDDILKEIKFLPIQLKVQTITREFSKFLRKVHTYLKIFLHKKFNQKIYLIMKNMVKEGEVGSGDGHMEE